MFYLFGAIGYVVVVVRHASDVKLFRLNLSSTLWLNRAFFIISDVFTIQFDIGILQGNPSNAQKFAGNLSNPHGMIITKGLFDRSAVTD